MTDQTPEITAEQQAGRALVARKEFKNEAVWLPMLAVWHWNTGETAIRDKIFTDCLIEGPAVTAVMEGTFFESCTMGTTTDVKTLLFRPVSRQMMAGVIGMANCRFERCRFVQVGFTGSDDLLNQLEAAVRPQSEVAS